MTPRFQIITHANGTHTLRDTVVGQEMHSRVGPWMEAKILYAEGSKIAEKIAQRGNLVLHDVGMGTGANVIATLEEIELSSSVFAAGTLLEVESFETEIGGLNYALQNLEKFPFLSTYQDQLAALLENRQVELTLPRSQVKVTWRLFEDDYFRALDRCKKPEIIFYDFYSIKAEPELWSEEAFRKLRAYLGSDACELYTYSAATPVRLALVLAGFFVGKGARTEMKTETTAAATDYDLIKRPLGTKWVEKLKVSTSISEEQRMRGLSLAEEIRLIHSRSAKPGE